MTKIKLIISHISPNLTDYDFLYELVSQERREKALRFKNKKDQIRSLIAGYLVEKSFKTQEFLKNEHSKPYLKDGPFFNLSHSGDYVCLGISPFDIGVDVEEIKNKDYSFIQKFFNTQVLTETEAYTLWTNSESFAKCLGTGIKDLKSIPLLLKDGKHVYKNKNYYTKNFIYNNHSFSITIDNDKDFKIEMINEEIVKK